MKSTLFIGLLCAAPLAFTPTANAKVNTFDVAQSAAINKLTTIINNTSTTASPELLQSQLMAAVQLICSESTQSTHSLGKCSASQIEQMLSAVTTATGANSPQLVNFLASLSAYGVDSNAITVAAILSGIDPIIASQEAAGSGGLMETTKALPLLSAPYSGAGGTGGDTGISEVGN